MEPNKLGKSMLTVAWVVALGLLTWFFSGVLDRRHNPNVVVSNGSKTVTLQRNRQGHYVANGKINGQPVTFFVDTGATSVSIPSKIAKQLNLQENFEITVNTANGNTKAYLTRLDTVTLGDLTLTDIRGNISPSMDGNEVLLGMSFLKYLPFSQQGDQLIIKAPN
jgi:aspartyl protease family protein